MNVAKKYKKVIITFLLIFGLLFGIFIYNKLSDDNIKYILENTSNIDYINIKLIIIHILILSISLLFSVAIIGILTLIIYILFECVVIGFFFSYFYSLYGISGICYSILYTLIFKALNIFLIIILINKYLKIIKILIKSLKKQSINLNKTINNILFVNFTIIINDIFLLFSGEKILNIFSFLLK